VLTVYDWTITSGGAPKQIQNMLNSNYDAKVGTDGVMGAETVDALNQVGYQDSLLQEIADL
jgi:type VI secretion system secreted protein VgrG